MRNTVLCYIDRFRHNRHERLVLGSVLLVLAIIVMLSVYWQLRYTGITMTNETYCGYEEHIHTEDCYEYTLICGLDESEGHTHDESCYDEEGNLICELEESEGHTHAEDCYEKTLICGLEEHAHTVECLVDITADVEDASVWEMTLPALSGDLRTDVVAIAYSQLSYTESTANYTLAEDGITHNGYTRYGAWYGSIYADWDSMFVAFCLDYAGISDEFTYNAGAYAWTVDLTNLGYYQLSESYTPTAGDIAFIDNNSDGKADVSAIVVAIDESSVTVIQGNYDDAVAIVTYSTASGITPLVLGYADISPEVASEEPVEEVTEEIAEETVEESPEEEIAIEEEQISEEEPAEESVEEVTEEITEEVTEEVISEEIIENTPEVEPELYEEEIISVALTAEDPYAASVVAEEEGGEGNEIILTATNVTYSDNLVVAADVLWNYDKVTYSEGTFDISFNITFSELTKDEIQGVGNTFYLYLPSGVDVTGITLGYEYTGYDTNNVEAFHFYFYEDDTSGDYYVKIVFEDSYIESLANDATVAGYIKFNSEVSRSDVTIDETNNTITIGTGSAIIDIQGSEIESGDSENWYADLNVSKSSSSYNATTKSITYTVTIYSTLGTQDEIVLEDLISSIVNNSSYTNTGVTVNSVEFGSVTYYSEYYSWNSVGWNSRELDSSEYEYDISADNELSVTLPKLSGPNGTKDSIGDAYVVTYTVYFDNASAEYNSSITNSVNATTETTDGTVTDYDAVTTTATGHAAYKTGSYNTSAETITWNITFNSSGADISGYTLTDKYLSEALGNTVTITHTDGTTVASSEYEINYNTNDGTIESITFLGSPNNNSYTISYTTLAGSTLGSSGQTVMNEVEITDSNGTPVGEAEKGVWVPASGSVSKDLKTSSAVTADGTTATRILTWQTTIAVPSGGVAADTVIKDYLGTYGGDAYYYQWLDSVDQWFTYDQITDFFNNLSTNGITLVDGSTGTDQTIENTDFTMSAYDPTNWTWVSYDDLIANPSTYANTKFTAYTITLTKGTEYNGTITLEYTTTADVTDVYYGTALEQSYYNSVKVGNLSSNDNYAEHERLYKTDGNEKQGTTTIDTEDGVLTWKVYLYIDAGSTYTYTITDTLPAGLTLDSIKVSFKDTSDYANLTIDSNGNITGNLTYNSSADITGSVTKDSNGSTVELEIDSDVYSWIASNGGYIIVTYTVSIDNFANTVAGYTTAGTHQINSYTNSVTVTWNGNSDTDSQIQDVTYTVEDTGSTPVITHDTVEKSGDYESAGGTIDYEVLLNIDGERLNNGKAMTFTDVASTYSNDSFGTYIELSNSSVKFYQLYEVTKNSEDQYIYTDDEGISHIVPDITASDIYAYKESDGTITYYQKVKMSIAWMYVENDPGWGTVYHTITAEIPDETAILVEYSYYVATVSGVDETFAVTNTATLVGETTTTGSDYNEEHKSYINPSVTGGITADGGITLIKVDENNYSTTIPNTKFALYKYTNGNWVQVTASDYNSYVDVNEDIWTIATSENPMDENNYLTTDSSGNLTVTKNYISGTSVLGTYSWYDPYTLYYVVEVKAGTSEDGTKYAISEAERIYFYWSDDNTSGTIAYPSDWDYSVTPYDLNTHSRSIYVTNAPVTTFTLKKVSSSDTSLGLSGATFALYVYKETDTNGKDVWQRIGTYQTDKDGEISITYDDELYSFNRAYRLVEVTPAEGYNIAWGDETEFYFWWSSDDYTTYAPVLPDNWGVGETDPTISEGTTYASAVDISSGSKTVTATNSKTSSTISVKKVWIDENGNTTTDPGYTATVQLYYYLATSTGTPVRLTTGTVTGTTELLTLTATTGSTADTTATLYSYTTETDLIAGEWTSIYLSASSMISAVYDDYTDGYVEVVIKGGDSPNNVSLIFQTTNTYDYITSVTPTSVTPEVIGTDTYYTVTYSIDSIKSALTAAGKTSSDVGGICLDTGSLTTAGTMQSLNVIGSAKTTDSDTSAYSFGEKTYGYSGTWKTLFYGDSSKISVDGAVLKINYSNATANTQISVGVQKIDESSEAKSVTLPDTSGTVYVSIGDIIGSGYDWSDYKQAYIMPVTWNTDGTNTVDGTTIDSVYVLVPATSTSEATTYMVADSSDTSASLTSGWSTYFYQNSTDASYMATSGAVIYIDYTCTSVPYWSQLGIQYTSNDTDTYSLTSLFSVGMNNTLAIPVSDILSGTYSLSDYNTFFIQVGNDDLDKVTINSVSILIPYSLSEAVAGTIVDVDYTVTLYEAQLGTSASVAIGNGTGYGTSVWNSVSSRATEPEYDYSNLNDTSTTNLFTGYGFLNALYANLGSTVEITLSDVTVPTGTDATTLLKSLQLIIQGDKSVGADGYAAIATVNPDNVTYNSDGTYTLTYSTSKITQALLSANSIYTDAADVYADYNAVILSLGGSYGSTDFTATVTNLKVMAEEINTTDTYTYSSLVGYTYGTPYTDESGDYLIYTLNSTNNWMVSLANLPLTTTINGTTYYYCYYFVETSYTAGSVAYTTTYSQREGENGGGEIVITNVATTYVLPSTGWTVDYQKLYEFGVLLIILALFVAGAYRNISHIRETLVQEPTREKIPYGCWQSVEIPDQRDLRFVIPRIVRKGDTRAGPEDSW
ncbi:MAG: hypothetical protein LUG49_08805 [Oscillospiraceae bacterium]|nr:hypothetical protein [Oscillospiraceae bacterium]